MKLFERYVYLQMRLKLPYLSFYLNLNMEDKLILKDLTEDLYEYFEKYPALLPDGVILNHVLIIGDCHEFPKEGQTLLKEWLVIFKDNVGLLEHQRYYHIKYDGLKLVNLRNAKRYNKPLTAEEVKNLYGRIVNTQFRLPE